jgi:hypothetical protein
MPLQSRLNFLDLGAFDDVADFELIEAESHAHFGNVFL